MALWAGRFSKEIDAGVIEAAKSMGASTWQIIFKVLLPESKPSLLVGAAISITTILGYSAMAGFIGGGGLGTVAVNYGYNRYNFYGISGIFDKEDESYGVYDFKRGFTGVVEEYIGYFTLPISDMMYKMYKKLKG